MSTHERLTRQYERVTALRVEEFMAQRMSLLNGALKWIENQLPDDYEPSVQEVVAVAEFLAGEGGTT